MKPMTIAGYSSDGVNSSLTNITSGTSRAVTNAYEVMSFVARSRSLAVGAQSGVEGVVNGGELDLKAQFRFQLCLLLRPQRRVWPLNPRAARLCIFYSRSAEGFTHRTTMKKRFPFYAAIIVTFVAIVWWTLHRRHAESGPSVQSEVVTSNSLPPTVASTAAPMGKPSAPASPSAVSTSSNVASTPGAPAMGTAALVEKFSQQIHRPIEFYGKVVDEKGQPVESATVTFGWHASRHA